MINKVVINIEVKRFDGEISQQYLVWDGSFYSQNRDHNTTRALVRIAREASLKHIRAGNGQYYLKMTVRSNWTVVTCMDSL